MNTRQAQSVVFFSMSAFLRYSKCHRNEVKRDNPDVDNTDISKMLGYNWRNSSEQEKEPFVTQELRESKLMCIDTSNIDTQTTIS